MDDISGYTVISLLIDSVDFGAMTRTSMPDGSTMLSLVLTSYMMQMEGNRVCQLMMTDGEKIMKSSQFCTYVSRSNNIEDALPDGATLTIINEKISLIIDDAVSDINDASTQAIAEVNAAGRQARESLPSDYNGLSTQVSTNTTDIAALKADLDAQVESINADIEDQREEDINAAICLSRDMEEIKRQFLQDVENDEKIENIIAKMADKMATHIDSQEYAIQVGEHAADALQNVLSSDVLPEGKMYYNIAERTVRPQMELVREIKIS